MADGTPLTLAHARHLLRRTGFGTSQAGAQSFLDAHPTRGAAVTALLGFKPSGFKPGGREHADLHDKWIKYMLKVKSPLQEKLVLFWHDHFATGISKVFETKRMASQNRLFRLNCKGNFRTLVKAVNKDPAMMEFLDTVRNYEEIPNENYARELMELFTLGVKDSAGADNYLQEDVAQIARAFTGWDYDKEAYLRDYEHDFSDEWPDRGLPIGAPSPAGNKRIFEHTGGFGGGGRDFAASGEGEAEIDTVVDIILEHKDSQGKNTVARRIARRLIEYFAHPSPDQPYIDAVVTASGFDTSFDVAALLHEIFVHDDFYLTAVPPVGAATPKSVRWPIDYVVTSLRLLKMKLKGKEQYVDGGSYNRVLDQLSNMGQVLFDPPSVFGWDWETGWVSSSTMLARYGFARDLTSARGGGGTSFRPDKLMDLDLSDPNDILTAATDVLGITGDLTAAEEATLITYLTDDGVNPALDLNDYETRNSKLHGLFALLMQTPAFQLQ
ncbi:MAG: DUF1800 domain-containing protein [Deltaproteobacteria bacterium]|nr:DUF1800 domain-containing protein [Deltaproteobacteria bacterium]